MNIPIAHLVPINMCQQPIIITGVPKAAPVAVTSIQLQNTQWNVNFVNAPVSRPQVGNTSNVILSNVNAGVPSDQIKKNETVKAMTPTVKINKPVAKKKSVNPKPIIKQDKLKTDHKPVVKIENAMEDGEASYCDTADAKCYICEECGASMKTFGTYYVHIRTSHTESTTERFTCPHCQATLKNKQTLRIHVRTHSGVKPFTCQLCSKTFTQRSSLNTHIKLHDKSPTYNCNLCQKSFKTKAYLNNHSKKHLHSA